MAHRTPLTSLLSVLMFAFLIATVSLSGCSSDVSDRRARKEERRAEKEAERERSKDPSSKDPSSKDRTKQGKEGKERTRGGTAGNPANHPVSNAGPEPRAVGTFHSIGLYWKPAGADGSAEATVTYKAAGSSSSSTGMPLWYDDREQEYKGSLLNLTPGTSYSITLTLDGTGTSETITASTWSEDFPVGETVYVDNMNGSPLVIDRSGSPSGYILYTPRSTAGAVLEGQYKTAAVVEVTGRAAYVIIRGLTIKGGSSHCILFTGPAHDIVIEDNDMYGWGTKGSQGWGQGELHAVFAGKDAPVERIVIQRNKIHNPSSDSNSWEEYRNDRGSYHPGGPKGIGFLNSAGNHVIRYNEVYSDFEHYFQDGFGGGTNSSFEGFPNRDSDIYGNYVANCWDDGIESEGANMNVRIWNNFIEQTYVSIAIATTSRGPLYIFRNVAGDSRKSPLTTDSDQYDRGPFIKAGGVTRQDTWFGGGRTYVFHNTVLQNAPQAGKSDGLGPSGGIIGSGGSIEELIARNNILLSSSANKAMFRDNTNSCTNDLDYDIYSGVLKNNCSSSPHESNGRQITGRHDAIYERVTIDRENGSITGILKQGSPALDAGEVIGGLSIGYHGAGPDCGAFESSVATTISFGTGAGR